MRWPSSDRAVITTLACAHHESYTGTEISCSIFNILNYVSHAKAQDGTKNALEIKLLKSSASFRLDIHRQLKSNFELDVF